VATSPQTYFYGWAYRISQVTGHCLYPDWVAAFFIPFTLRNNAIIILPNYRLVPEHTGVDIKQDLDDFWIWFHSPALPAFLASKLGSPPNLDYTKLLVSGESAGGYMALMSGLTQPRDSIKAILAQYPMTNYLRREPSETLFDAPAPGPQFVDEYMASVAQGTVVSSAIPPARSHLTYALSAHGRYLEFFGSDEKLWPVHLVEDKTYMPPTWIVHGDKDAAVSIDDVKEFAEKWKKYMKEGELKLEIRKGEDHGFDVVVKEDEEEWLKHGLQWVEGQWLK
jgi:acetyl esterase/lipase